ncbi:SAM-dependent methyltransferase [Kitasatospora sp. NPDC058263]
MGWMSGNRQERRWPGVDLRMDVPHSARVYDYLIGGKTNFEADRTAAHASVKAWPALPTSMRTTRTFMQRVVRHLAEEHKVRQFLDIGTGIPAVGSTAEVAHRVAPDARVVYVDNDPIVLTHARALLAYHPAGHTSVLHADLRDPEAILGDPGLKEALDLSRPVALMLVAVLHFVRDEEGAAETVARLRDALAPGSMLILSHGTQDFMTARAAAETTEVYSRASSPLVLRAQEEVREFFGDFELVDPGLVQLPLWRPQAELPPRWQEAAPAYAGVAVKR